MKSESIQSFCEIVESEKPIGDPEKAVKTAQ